MSRDTTDYRVYPEAEIEHRVNFFDGMFLSVQDFIDQQRHRVDRIRRALDHLSISGIVRGLELSSARPGYLIVGPGTAVDAVGRQISIADSLEDIEIPQPWRGRVASISIVYHETEERVMGGSANEQGARGATRVREQARIEFHSQGSTAPSQHAVCLGNVTIAEDGNCIFTENDPARVYSGLRFPGTSGELYVRALAPVQPNMLSVNGSVSVGDALGIRVAIPEARLDVNGLTRLDDAHIRSHGFKVEGGVNTFYPVVFKNTGWASGMFDLEVVRSNSHTDGQASGSLVLRCRGHSGVHKALSSLSVDIHQSKRFVASTQFLDHDGGYIVLWLMGGRSYVWRATHEMQLHVIGGKQGTTVAGVDLAVKTAVEDRYNREYVQIAPSWFQLTALELVSLEGDSDYSGTLNRLDVRDTPVAMVRAKSLLLGHSSQRGGPASALLDAKQALVVNPGAGWPQLQLGGLTTHRKGYLAVDTDDLNLNRTKAFLTSVVADSEHFALVRPVSNAGGTKLFLDLQQSDQKKKRVPEVQSQIRFHHQHRYDVRLEAGSSGFRLRSGDNKNSISLSTGDLKVTGALETTAKLVAGSLAGSTAKLEKDAQAPALTVVGTIFGKQFFNQLPVRLVRSGSESTGGAISFLDLAQDDSSKKRVPEVRANIRFHHGYRFWHGIEASGEGLSFRHGDLNSNDFVTVHTGSVHINGALSMTDQAAATIRCFDFKIGHKGRRGEPARALVDGKDKFHLNFSGDWSELRLNGKVYASTNMYAGGKPIISGLAETGLRLIRGTVKGDGNIESGSGFTVEREGNKWKVNFSPAFSVVPSVVAQIQYPDNNTSKNGGDTRDNAVIVAVDKRWAYVKTGDNDGDGKQRRFHFLAAGR